MGFRSARCVLWDASRTVDSVLGRRLHPRKRVHNRRSRAAPSSAPLETRPEPSIRRRCCMGFTLLDAFCGVAFGGGLRFPSSGACEKFRLVRNRRSGARASPAPPKTRPEPSILRTTPPVLRGICGSGRDSGMASDGGSSGCLVSQ